MKDDEMIKLRSIKVYSSSRVHSFLFFIIDGAWVVWEVLSPSPELSPPPEWTDWGGGYGYVRGGGCEYDWAAGPPDEPPTGGGGYEYDREALPPDEPPIRGYGYGGYPYGGDWSMDTVDEHYHPMNHRPEVVGTDMEDSGMGEDMTVEVEAVEREHTGMLLVRHWTGHGAERHQWAHREWEELATSECLKGHTTFTSQDSNYSPWRRVSKSEE
jgi:hypothetical protein